MRIQDNVEIRDSLTFELLSTLTSSGDCLDSEPTYSPDGRSLVCLSKTALIIWDIQTGGVAKRIKRSGIHGGATLLWSSDGETIGIMTTTGTSLDSFRTCCVASGAIQSFDRLRTCGNPHFWAHGKTFRITTITWAGKTLTADTFEASGSTFTSVQSLSIQPGEEIIKINSFSPSTNCVSVSTGNRLVILDLRNSNRLLIEKGEFISHHFSSDGGLFAAFLKSAGATRVWKWASGCYTTWREFPCQDTYNPYPPLLFSPNSSFILGLFDDTLRVWRLSDHHFPPSNGRQQLAAISHHGTYIATAKKGHRTITIINPLLPTPSQFIDTDTEIQGLVLTGNILLAVCPETTVAWHLTEEGAVSGVLGRWQAYQSDGVWTLPRPQGGYPRPMFAVEGQTVAIMYNFLNPHVYHTGTGEVFHHVQAPPVHRWYDLEEACKVRRRLQYRSLRDLGVSSKDDWPISLTTLGEGWIKDPEGKHRLWLPSEWRIYKDIDWFYEITTLQFDPLKGKPQIIIKF